MRIHEFSCSWDFAKFRRLWAPRRSGLHSYAARRGGRHGCQYTLLGSIAIEDDAVGQNNAYRSTRVSGMAARL